MSRSHAAAAARAENAAKARAVLQRNAAVRALDDPVKVARAARIVRAALERQRLTLEDIGVDDRVAST